MSEAGHKDCGLWGKIGSRAKVKIMKVRMQITKDPEIRFVSHLDYLRAIERGLRRADLPVAYSEGFNPHMKFSLASALGVGVVSYAEFVEIEMAEPVSAEEAVKQLRCKLPKGIRILAADVVPNNEPALMARAACTEYEVLIPAVGADLVEKVEKFNGAETLIYKKPAPKRRCGYKEVDIKRYIDKVEYWQENGNDVFRFEIKIFEDGSLKAADVLTAVGVDCSMADVRRLGIYRENHEEMLRVGK